MNRLFLLLLVGCAPHIPRIPGPLGPVASTAPRPISVSELPRVIPKAPPEPEPAVASRPRSKPSPRRRSSGAGEDVASSARHFIRSAPPSRFRNDCSGYVMASFDRAGIPLQGNSRSLWADAKDRGQIHHDKRPQPGDIAFFDNTYDRNGNGRRDDSLTHVAVVIEVLDDGTILLGHGGTSKGRAELRMNLIHPTVRRTEDGQILNDYLRARRKGEPENGKYLAGQLLRGFARVRSPSG